MSDHDLRRQADEIRSALERYDREQLLDILSHVFRQYVIEGHMPVSLPTAPTQVVDELQGLSFAQVIERLQLRLDLPELQAFEVSAGRVSIRIEGRTFPVEAPGAAPQPGGRIAQVQVSLRSESAGSSAQAVPQPAPGVMPAPGQPAQAAPQPAAAPASMGLGPVSRSVAPRPEPPRSGAPTSTRPAASPAPAAPPKEERPGEDTGGRFTLLEID